MSLSYWLTMKQTCFICQNEIWVGSTQIWCVFS